ncbi:MAG: response regulator [Rhodospirillales bacterium]|nr:response regulator [Rhodospirillales bacterium]
MEAIGTLAGGIAHDFNNILSIILGYTGLTLDHEHIDDETKENLGMILEAANRARGLVDQILTFSRRGEQQRIQVEMQSILEDGLRLLRSSLPSTVEIRKEIGPGPFSVMADPTQMHQVLMNLCTNAGQAMEAGGILEVKLDHAARAGTPPGASLGEVAGRDVRIMVRDTGVGMDAETMERVFEPFYTTKAPGVGTGLGLSVVHGIVSDHGGSIVVKSAAGAGTTFTVLLPVGEVGTVDVAVEPSPIPTGEGRILFVDDEPAVVRMGEKLLGRLGYEVICETSSLEALRRFRSDPDQFDLVVTDQTMPDMTGEVLAQEIRRIRHNIPVIVCTGFSKAFTRERARELGIDGYVMKPSLATDLGQVVHDVLRDRAASG